LSRVEIHRAESKITDVPDDHDHGLASVELASGSGEAPALVEGNAEADILSGQAEPLYRIGKGDAPIVPASALRLCSVQALGSHGGSPFVRADFPHATAYTGSDGASPSRSACAGRGTHDCAGRGSHDHCGEHLQEVEITLENKGFLELRRL
jgi:hypothetical protein